MSGGTRLLQRGNLRVVKVVIEVRTLAEYGLGPHQDTPDSWIWRGERSSAAGKL